MTQRKDAKSQSLEDSRTLNLHPERVTDPLFLDSEFFDARDLLQVKYEMLRRVRAEGMSVTQAAAAFGFSRPAFYQALAALEGHGLAGLIPKRPGPKQAHKLSDEVLDYLEEQQALEEALRSPEWCEHVLKKLGLSVHPRSIERAFERRRKKGR